LIYLFFELKVAVSQLFLLLLQLLIDLMSVMEEILMMVILFIGTVNCPHMVAVDVYV
jgi:hypothetical protein